MMTKSFSLVLVLITIFSSCAPDNETVLYEELTPSAFREKLNQAPVAYLPLGTLEYHGEHLPLGTDALHSKGFFIEMAQEFGGIVLPMIFMGPSWYTGQAIDSLIAIHCTPSSETGSCYWIPDSVYHMLMEQQFSLLSQTGFKVVVVHGHAPSIIYVEWHKQEWEEQFDIRIVPYFIYRDHGELGYSGHASVNETSLIMNYFPHLVKMQLITADTSIIPYGIQSKNPRGVATAKIGKKMEEVHMKILSDTLNKILKSKYKLHPDDL
jgi:creatinine amidohydrolase